MHAYFLRLGSLAEIDVAAGEPQLEPGSRVIVRTRAGLQVGEILRECRDRADDRELLTILRPMTAEDELLVQRLQRHKRRAIERCRQALEESGSQAILLDVDQVLDGTNLIMHFLGKVDQRAEAVTELIIAEYESVVRSRHFAKLLRDGCGPDCGSGSGCESGGCSGCGVAAACHVTH